VVLIVVSVTRRRELERERFFGEWVNGCCIVVVANLMWENSNALSNYTTRKTIRTSRLPFVQKLIDIDYVTKSSRR
jgi:hypothetical protein